MTQQKDAELVGKTRNGDNEAYKELVARYQGHVYGLAYSIVSNWADAQDIAQETFIRAYSNIDQLKESDKFAVWLRRVAFGVAINWLKTFRPGIWERFDGKADIESMEFPDFQPGPAELVEKRDLAEAVMTAVESLPQKYRVPLTMFHLDGLSYQKVAEFLDIPLGTAKSLICRAREKLKPALSAYAINIEGPEVQEVFNEHKLPVEFAGQVLKGIKALSYKESECTFCGTISRCMEFLKEDFTYDFVMGISGSAFKLLWYPQWCTSNNTLLVLGTEVIERTFKVLGYEWQGLGWLAGEKDKDKFLTEIKKSIDKGIPVIAEGIIGPPECGVITGYDEKGDVLFGHSYFHDGSKGYYEKRDWLKDCFGLIIIGNRKQRPERQTVLKETIEWAVKLARTPEWKRGDGARYICGLAAYDAWAEALRKDEDFPEDNLDVLTFRCQVNGSVTLSGLRDARNAAVKFLVNMGNIGGAATQNILVAIAAYEKEVQILSEAVKIVPYSWSPEKQRLQMADSRFRRQIAKFVLEAKNKDEEAIKHLEEALNVFEY